MPSEIRIRVYEELNDFLPRNDRKVSFPLKFIGTLTVRDVLERLRIPHCEVDLILVNSTSVTFDYKLKGGEQVSIYPVFETLDITPLNKLRPRALREMSFVLDVHLGELAKLLRFLGFDTFYENHLHDDEIVRIALNDKRLILTRDKLLLMRKEVTHGYFLRNINPYKQVEEVVLKFQLQGMIKPFTRCSVCNGEISEIEKREIVHLLPEDTLGYYDKFFRCSSCNRIYWEGSHHKKIKRFIDSLVNI